MVKLQPVHGFAAETTAALIIQVASLYGIPLSTTHVISTSIMGVGAVKRFSGVKWIVVERIVWAWIFTLPATGTRRLFAHANLPVKVDLRMGRHSQVGAVHRTENREAIEVDRSPTATPLISTHSFRLRESADRLHDAHVRNAILEIGMRTYAAFGFHGGEKSSSTCHSPSSSGVELPNFATQRRPLGRLGSRSEPKS